MKNKNIEVLTKTVELPHDTPMWDDAHHVGILAFVLEGMADLKTEPRTTKTRTALDPLKAFEELERNVAAFRCKWFPEKEVALMAKIKSISMTMCSNLDLNGAQELWEETMMSAVEFNRGNLFNCADELLVDVIAICVLELRSRGNKR